MVLSTLRRLFHKHRYVGNAVFYTCLLTSADFVCQKIQFGILSNYDWERTGRMATMGFFYYGPISTFVYNNLDRILPGTGPRIVFKKLLFDQFVFTCISTVIFYAGKLPLLIPSALSILHPSGSRNAPSRYSNSIFKLCM